MATGAAIEPVGAVALHGGLAPTAPKAHEGASSCSSWLGKSLPTSEHLDQTGRWLDAGASVNVCFHYHVTL